MPELPADTGSILTHKLGPLPTWGWGIVILGGAYGVKLYRDHKGAGSSTTPATTAGGYTSASLPSNIQPQFTQVDEGGSQSYVNSPISMIGRQVVDAGGTGVTQSVTQTGNTVTVQPPPVPPPTPVTTPVVAPPAPAGQYVTITKWKPHQKKGTPSTIAGLAFNAYGNENAWHKIWTAPQNADLVARRGKPSNIQTGDKFFVPQ